ncbi:RNA ligase-domain-containing protein [Mycena pura]|uniref:tRNA ligase n=1 Tax=Mycena pura TaxID=153505 RepID=A0AAD6XYH3_9AGAR|nr:RNA ligase-domain-containing protein [Mycena pura]
MAHSGAAEGSALIKELVALSRNNGKLVRSSKYTAPADSSITVSSWKMAEHKYYVVPSPFPTLARGIFSVEQPDGEHRIVARGYDKFFNIGEVGWTTWAALEQHTSPPYNLSLKSNGCIIFIAALTPDKLLITSKHSVGPASGEKKLSHADAGEGWLRKYLAQKGRTEADLASVLWGNNWTAVAELCDDSFEEHVLAYPPELTGLHLHGINESTRAFKTLSQAQVNAFAAEWGFIQTESTELATIDAVRAFTSEVGKTGAWNGVPVEGFVVRTHVSQPSPDASPRSAPPYPAGSSLFFKVKFDEPYMMYRDWREVTKSLLGMRNKQVKGKDDGMSVAKLPKSKMRRSETQAYARWVIEEIRRDPTAFAEYNDNKGIIAVRERFLAFLASDKGKQAVREKSEEPATTADPFGKTVILPIAIPGCGKTAVAVALSHIFGFAHTQSDDVQSRKAAPLFIKNVTDLLKTHDVVIADKNNHLVQHRQALRDATASFSPRVRLMALNWSLDAHAPAMVHRICADRVQTRGEKHQTLRPDAAKGHEDVLWTFIAKTEPLAPIEVDEVVEMALEDGLEDMVRRAVDACVRVLGLPSPGAATVNAALERAREYAPQVKRSDLHAGSGKAKAKDAKAPRYFALLPEVELGSILGTALAEVPFWQALQQAERVTQRPHVTLVHKNALTQEDDEAAAAEAREFWARCKELHEMTGGHPLFRLKLGHVVWNERVMAVTVDDVQLANEGAVGQAGAEFVAMLPEEARKRLHITVGTRDADVPPVEAKNMVEEWRKTGGGAQSVPLGGVATGRVKGLIA